MNDDAVAVAREFWRLMASNDFASVAAVLADDFRARMAAVEGAHPRPGELCA